MKIVIVGGVAAGMSTAARLRRLDERAEIVVLERDRYVSYANCGLPYHIGGDIQDRERLLVVTPEHLRTTLNLDVRTEHEVLAIDRAAKLVSVRERATGRTYAEAYDSLVLALGGEPIRPPVPGVDHPRIFTLRSIPDMDRIIARLEAGARRAVVIGASYIGAEMVEALRRRGLAVDLVELQDQIMPLLDRELAAGLRDHMLLQGVRLHLGAAAQAFEDRAGGVAVVLGSGARIEADLVVLAVGVRPAVGLARAAGLALGPRGGVQVDAQLRTSDPSIFAAGDMVEVIDSVTGEPAVVALAGPANRQGRIVADTLAGRASGYTTTQGTAIVKIFEMTGAITGASEKRLRALGRPYRKIYIHPSGHAGYYPGTAQMQLKLLFAPGDGAILGAQIVGFDGVDKRIDVLATAIRAGMSVFDLERLELAYAPPYGSAKDPVNMAGFVAGNLLRGDVAFWYAEDYPLASGDALIVDVRGEAEYADWHIDGARNIPLPQLRERLAELRELAGGRRVLLYCMVGFRSYLAYRTLAQHGFEGAATLAGGGKTFACYHGAEPAPATQPPPLISYGEEDLQAEQALVESD
ncbi:MAG: FAD-dependent oxidoreductase [Kouleothrix sp.]|nr:FAD-dependent oxidoreductase [Kouleothrix sp.]